MKTVRANCSDCSQHAKSFNKRSKLFQRHMYPSSIEFQDTQHARNWIPKLLNSFLDHPVCSDVKKAALGHSVVQAVRPKTVISPLLLGLTVSLDHVCGWWLINLLSRLGFFLSYDELIRFQHERRNRGVHVPPPPPFLEGGYKRVHSVKVCVYPVVR